MKHPPIDKTKKLRRKRLVAAKKHLSLQARKFRPRGGHNHKGKPVKLGINAEG